MSGLKKKKSSRKKESGMSLLESLPLIMVLASLVGFLLGLWGMTHKNILHSIAARNYAFETFNHRANLTYFHDTRPIAASKHSYELSGVRFHAIGDGSGSSLKAFSAPIRLPEDKSIREPAALHRERIWNDAIVPSQGEATEGTRRPWILVNYGICLNSNCGEN